MVENQKIAFFLSGIRKRNATAFFLFFSSQTKRKDPSEYNFFDNEKTAQSSVFFFSSCRAQSSPQYTSFFLLPRSTLRYARTAQDIIINKFQTTTKKKQHNKNIKGLKINYMSTDKSLTRQKHITAQRIRFVYISRVLIDMEKKPKHRLSTDTIFFSFSVSLLPSSLPVSVFLCIILFNFNFAGVVCLCIVLTLTRIALLY